MHKAFLALLTSIILFIFEHVTRLHNIPNISSLLREVAYWSRELFYKIGLAFSHLSSFLNLIEFEELIITLKGLGRPVLEVLTSPLQTIRGYIDAALEYAHPTWVIGGSFIILVILWVIWRKYKKLPLMPKFCREFSQLYEHGGITVIEVAPSSPQTSTRSNSRGRKND